MRHEIISWDTRKSPVLQENLMSHAFSINPMRKSHEIWDYLMRQKTGDFLIGAPPHKKISCLTRKSHVSCVLDISHEKISWDMKFSHETGDRRFSPGGTPMTKSPVSWENIMSHAFSINPMRKSRETWDFLMRQETADFLLGGPSPQENLLSHEKISCLMPSL